ncbi:MULTISPECIES: hypothetical protein [Francisella]|uniref:ABC-type transport auxiliary lipoprotein component domain-containing protein n=1 Tax=Francisella salina TaxID=573569 RepID=A0ABN3ZUF8_FRAST|nr:MULTISPECIES: hypothetical protein [Francisella]AEI35983.1 hypothetical protein F7308_1056 [Francisella salina]
MKKYIILFTILLPFQLLAFSIFGDPLELPAQKQYVIYNQEMESKKLPDTGDAYINTTLLIYNIQTQASKSTQMFYIKGNRLYTFKNSEWALPVSKMLTVATFEYILDNNIVKNLAFQDINIRQEFTLSGTTTYGPILDLDNKQFFFYITFYLKNERTGYTDIKTIKYHHKIDSDNITPDSYAEMTNKALVHIFSQLKPWLLENLEKEKHKNKQIEKRQKTMPNNIQALLATKQ